MGVGDGGDGADVDEAEGWVTGGLDPYKFGVFGANEGLDVDFD